jgi:3-deoxy-D-manno-octulosonic-acid transferase
MTIEPFSYRFYRALTDGARPLAHMMLLERSRRNKEDRTRLGERRGEATRSRPAGPLVWVHGASVGESLSLLPIIEALAADDYSVVVTSGTVTSAQVLARRLPEGSTHQYMPLDVSRYVDRFLDHWRPDLAIFAESEIWPNMLCQAHQRGIPLVLVNARMSARSFRRWSQMRSLANYLFTRFDLCLAQSQADAERLVRLGAPRVTVTGNLKFDSVPPPASAVAVAGMNDLIGGRPLWLAASTHAGEELLVIEAHRRLAQRYPDLLTIIAPRHPERGREIYAASARQGLRASQRALGLQPDMATDIYIADTIGEMGLFYRIAPIVFLGGSLVPHGGQNPIEPAKLGAALIHGPHIHNFTEVYAALEHAGGAYQVNGADDLAATLDHLIDDQATREDVAQRGTKAVMALGGALRKTMMEIAPYLLKMHLGNRP